MNKNLTNILIEDIEKMTSRPEQQNKTEEFLKLIKPLPRHISTVKKYLKKQEKLEEQRLKTIHNLFDENEQLKQELRQIRNEKRQTTQKLRNAKTKQALDFKRERMTLISKLKEKQKKLQETIKVHPRVVSLRETREKKKIAKLTSQQTYNYENLQYESIKVKSAFNDKSTEWIIRKKLSGNDRNHDIIFYSNQYEPEDDDEDQKLINADVAVILIGMKETRKNLIEQELKRLKGITINERIKCVFRKWDETQNIYLYYNVTLPKINDNKQCKARINNTTNIDKILNKHNDIILNAIEEFVQNGSNYQLYSIKAVKIDVDIYSPLGGGSYIDLPDFIKNKQCCINVKNKDDECFNWAIKSCIMNKNVKHHPERTPWYDNKQIDEILIKAGVTYPFEPKENIIRKVENKINRSINIYTFDKTKNGYDRYPIYITKNQKEDHINLLYFSNEDQTKYHYVWIKNFSGFLSDTDGHDHKRYYCMKCMTHFTSEEKLKQHNNDFPVCHNNQPAKIEYPTKDKAHVMFKNYNNKFKCPFVIYADFESVLIKNDEKTEDDKITHKHMPCGYMYYVVSTIDKYNIKPKIYRGEDAVKNFLEEILKVANTITYLLKQNIEMIITDAEEIEFNNSTLCHICEKELFDDRVRDHCHLTGKYIGPAHNACNLNRIESRVKIPIFFHNGKGYDSHFIINEIANIESIKDVDLIPKTDEKYISYSFNHLRFLDSLAFMCPDDSLEKLVESLRNKDEYDISKFKLTQKYFKKLYPNLTDEQMKLIITKGVYPYEYMDSFDRFNESCLPPINMFYSSLNNSSISDKDYKHALKVWETFNIKTMGDYHDFYLQTDVLLLADVFENFREVDMNTYKLDPAHYVTGCSYSFDASLKKYGKKIELFNDEQSDMYLFVENAIRGGMSFIAHRHSVANNKYMKNFDPSKPSKYIMYLDANNLYGWAMMQKLATGGYAWENVNDWNEEKIMKIDDNDKRGYIFNVDLEYPAEIHDKHNLYPLCPERKKVCTKWLSPFQKQLKDKLKIADDQVEKLITDLSDKNNYTLHYKNLQLYLQLGMKLIKINKCLSYNSEAWLKDYIVDNSLLRQKAKANKDAFKANIYKIKNNGVFGKQMENVRNRVDVKLCKKKDDNDKKYVKLLSHPTYKRRTIFNENLVAVHRHKRRIVLDKPIINGMIILDLSKYLMYDFYYNFLQKRYGEKMKLLFSDTDSLCVEIETEDVYKDMQKDKQYYDFSEYPEKHFLYSTENQAVVGKFKDEYEGEIITEFVGLRSKLYSLIAPNAKPKKREKKVAKGCKKSVIENELKFKDYWDTLEQQTQMTRSMNLIKSKLHKVHTEKINKIVLSAFDNKRFLLDDGITSYAYGHCKTKQLCEANI